MVNGVDEVIALLDESSRQAQYHGESGSRVLSPHLLMPAQYYPSPALTPYHRLLLAVLEDAIRCFRRNLHARRGRRRALFQEAKEWLFDPNGTAFMSCPMVCDSLGIESARLRQVLREWQTKMSHGLDTPRLPRRALIFANKPIH